MTTSMTPDTPVSPPPQELASRRRTRAMAVVAAVIAALAIWAVAELALGIELLEPPMGGGDPEGIGARQVAVTAAGAGLAAWSLLALLERWTARPWPLWATAAVLTFAGSLLPLLEKGSPASHRVTLAALHVAVAGVLVGVMGRTAGRTAG